MQESGKIEVRYKKCRFQDRELVAFKCPELSDLVALVFPETFEKSMAENFEVFELEDIFAVVSNGVIYRNRKLIGCVDEIRFIQNGKK